MSTSRVSKITVCAAAVVLAALACLPASAALTPITTPGAAYTSSTALLPITGAEFDTVPSLTDGILTATFDTAQTILVVPDSWGTWGIPPDTESATPTVLYTNGASSLSIAFSKALSTFGLEAEPDLQNDYIFTMEFFSGATSLGSITRTINGNGGARLLAASSDTMFNNVVVSTDAGAKGFATTQLRYAPVPEPSSLLVLLSGVGGLGGLILRKRS